MPITRDDDQHSGSAFYISSASSTERYIGVFEFVDGVAYFYLYDNDYPTGHKIVKSQSIKGICGEENFAKLSIVWNELESVELTFEGTLIAQFDI